MPKAQADAKKADLKAAEKKAAEKGVVKPRHRSTKSIDEIQRENSANFIKGMSEAEKLAQRDLGEVLAQVEAKAAAETGSGVDEPSAGVVQSGFSVFNQAQGGTMSETPKTKLTDEQKAAIKAEREAKAAAKAEEKARKEAERKAAQEARAEKLAAEKEAKAAAKAEREAAAARRRAELEAMGGGKMVALRAAKDRYVKSATGRLRSTDEVATAFDMVQPAGVVEIAMLVLGLSANPYAHLNVGQQSMNLRNKLRGAVRKDPAVLQRIIETRDSGNYTAPTLAAIEAARVAREAAAAKAAAKTDAKTAEPVAA